MSVYDNSQTGNDSIDNPVPHYVERFGLSTAPFSNQHEDRFVYLDAERLQRLNMLEHLTRYSELLLIITAPKGMGKTSLLQRFVLNTDEDTLVSQVNASPMMDADTLLQAIAHGFGLTIKDNDPGALQNALYYHLADLHHKDKTPLLVIDDAHVLPQAALETLFNLADAEASDGNLLRIILFSDPQIETMLQSPAIRGLRERVTHSMEIPPLDEEQTVGYIRHRLHTAGLQGKLPYSDKELHKIFRNSDGIPARINECAHLILNGDKLDQAVKDFHTPKIKSHSKFKFPSLKFPAGLTQIGQRFKLWQLTLATLLIISISLGLIYQDTINTLFEPEHDQALTSETLTRPLPVPEIGTPLANAESPDVQEMPTAKPEPVPTAPVPDLIPEDIQAVSPLLSEVATPLAEKTDANHEIAKSRLNPETDTTNIPEPEATTAAVAEPAPQATGLLISDISPDPVKTSRKPQTIAILGEHFSKEMKVTVFWTGGKKMLSSTQVNIISPNEMELFITVGRKPDNWIIKLSDPLSSQKTKARFTVITATATKEKSATTSSPTIKRHGLKGENWIKKQTPKYFTLQLLGSQQKQRLENFVKQNKLEQDIAWFAYLRNDQPWYVLVQGRYTDRSKAEKAVAEITKNIPRIKPWIRPFADIQKTIKQQTITPPVASINKNTAPPRNSNKTTNAAWLWSQDPSHYTLQLLGGQTEAGIQRFIQKHKLSGKVVYYRTTRNQRPWYVLVYNSYPDRAKARATISSLPQSLRKTQPWPRTFASIHAELQ